MGDAPVIAVVDDDADELEILIEVVPITRMSVHLVERHAPRVHADGRRPALVGAAAGPPAPAGRQGQPR